MVTWSLHGQNRYELAEHIFLSSKDYFVDKTFWMSEEGFMDRTGIQFQGLGLVSKRLFDLPQTFNKNISK